MKECVNIMKVLHLIGGEDFGGAKSHVISLVTELTKNIDVKIVTFRKGAFSEDADKLGIEIEVVKTNSFFGDVKRLINIIKNENITLIHSHGAKANLFSVIMRIITKVPNVTTVHSDYRLDYLDSRLRQWTFGLINSLAIRLIDYQVAVSKNFKKMLINRLFNPENISVLYNGIQFDTDKKQYSREDFLKKFNITVPKGSTIVGILARFHPVKGIDVFLDAAGLIAKKYPQTVFVIGGEGEERKTLEERAQKLGIRHNTHFIGYIDDPYEFMECLDINTLTSWSESFPYVILEGAHQHKTVVSSNVGGINDLIVNGETGFLFEPGDSAKMAQHVITLIENTELRDNLGENLFSIASEKFSLINMGKTQLQIYKDILKKVEIRKNSKLKHDIILSGYYGFDNLGDDAMLLGIIDSLKEYNPYLKILILSQNPMQTKLRFGHNSINRLNIMKILLGMKKSRLFINGGGNLIQDNTSTRSLLYYLGTIWLAKSFGMKVMIYGNGIGPLNKEFDQKLSSMILNKVDVITLREEISNFVLKNIHVTKPKISITADPAFTLDIDSDIVSKNILFEEAIPATSQLVGYCIRKWPEDGHAAEELAKIADYVSDKYNTKPIFIPMHHPFDIEAANLIVSKMKNKAYVISNKYSVSEIMQLISKLDLLIGMRLHSLIFAVKVGVPVIGISYEPKVDGFLNLIGQKSDINIRNISFEALKEKVDYVWENKDNLRTEIMETNKKITALAKNNTKFVIELLENKGGLNG